MTCELAVHFVGGVEIGRVTSPRRRIDVEVVGHIIVTNVVRNVLANKQVVRVVRTLIGLTLRERTGVKDLEGTDPAFNGPVDVRVLVLNEFFLEPLYLVVIAQIGVSVEGAVRLDL